MHTLNYIRKNTYRRNDNIFKKVYGKRTLSKNFSLFRVNPYSKIKTILNIEIACLLIYLLLRTKLSANIVSISGVVWSLIGIIFLSFYNSFLFYLGIIILFLKLIPDYVDGQLALFQKKISLTGHELDGWAGNMSTIIILSGFYLWNWKQSFWKPRYILLIIFYCFIFLIRRFKIAFIKVQNHILIKNYKLMFLLKRSVKKINLTKKINLIF